MPPSTDVSVASLKAIISRQRHKKKAYKARLVTMGKKIAVSKQQEKHLRARILDLEGRLDSQEAIHGVTKVELAAGSKGGTNGNPGRASLSETIAHPPRFEDGLRLTFMNWRFLVEQKFAVNGDHFESTAGQIAYLISCMSGEAQDQLVTRMRSTAFKPIEDVKQALDYMEMLYGITPRGDNLDSLPFFDKHNAMFWKHFRNFVWCAVKFEYSEKEWRERLYRYLYRKYKKDYRLAKISDLLSFDQGTAKDLAEEFYARLIEAYPDSF
ncbi:hypothetical protein BJX99DRAFT_259040 [Aspergillus californicus]